LIVRIISAHPSLANTMAHTGPATAGTADADRVDDESAKRTGEDGSTADPRAPLRDLPPSAKLVALVLEREGPLTQSALAEETMLPPRTVRYAVTRLEAVDAVRSRVSFVDARQRRYELSL
jgi:DNA-binding MarR family transcriptional regulator